jgi:hypothetical protein
MIALKRFYCGKVVKGYVAGMAIRKSGPVPDLYLGFPVSGTGTGHGMVVGGAVHGIKVADLDLECLGVVRIRTCLVQ